MPSDTLVAKTLRSVADLMFDGSVEALSRAIGFRDGEYVRQCLLAHYPGSSKLIRGLRALERRIPSMQAHIRREASERCAKLDLLPLVLRSLPDPDERPYERQLGPLGGIRKRSDRRTRKAHAEAKQKKPARRGRLELGDLLLDVD